MITVRIDPATNIVTIDEPTSDTIVSPAYPTYRDAIAAAVEALNSFGRIMDELGAKNFDLGRE